MKSKGLEHQKATYLALASRTAVSIVRGKAGRAGTKTCRQLRFLPLQQ